MEVKIDAKRVAVVLASIVVGLTIINSVLLILYFSGDRNDVSALVDVFDFDTEGNVPTLYSAAAMLLATALLALITRANWRKPEAKPLHWLGLTVLFLFLSIDEGTAIHEKVGSSLESVIAPEGVFYFLWILPYGLATAAIGVAYLKFLSALPADTRRRFIQAGLMFLGGAVGLEMLGAREAEAHGYFSPTYSFLYTVEETLEMFGIVLFIYALIHHLAKSTPRMSVLLGAPEDSLNSAKTESRVHPPERS